MKVSFVMHPCPALLDSHGTPFGPVRTNFFPQPQMTLASALVDSGFELVLLDLRTLPDHRDWAGALNDPYAPAIEYGRVRLSRHLIGDYRARIAASPDHVDACQDVELVEREWRPPAGVGVGDHGRVALPRARPPQAFERDGHGQAEDALLARRPGIERRPRVGQDNRGQVADRGVADRQARDPVEGLRAE